MSAIPAITASSSLTVVAIGAAANLAASNKPLASRSWNPLGGFIGIGRRAKTAVADLAAPAGKKVFPIGGQTGKPAPPCPFGKFPKHNPTKLPGPPRAYDPANFP